MSRLKCWCWALLLLCASGADAWSQERWRFDPSASELNFTARYENEALSGRFGHFNVRIGSKADGGIFGPLVVEVETGSVDMNDEEVNQELGEQDWFDSLSFPLASYEASGLRQLGHGRYVAEGGLTLKGIVHQLHVPFVWEEKDGSGIMTGQVNLSRQTWRVGAGEWADDDRISDQVRLNFRAVFHRSD